MIEAVNSVLSNAQALRTVTEQVDVSRAQNVVPETTREIAVPKAPYISPFLSIDVNFDTTVLQIRDADTGDVINQFPSESRLQQRQRDQIASQRVESQPQSSSSGIGFQAQTQFKAQEVSSSSDASVPQTASVPQAQIASAALAAAAQSGINGLSAGVSVAA